MHTEISYNRLHIVRLKLSLAEVMFSLPFVGLFVCVKAGLGKHCPAALHETWQRGGAREKKGPIKFSCGSGSPSSFNSEFVLIFSTQWGAVWLGTIIITWTTVKCYKDVV